MAISKVIDELHDQIYKETGKTGLQASDILVPVLLTLRQEAASPQYAALAEDALLPEAAEALGKNGKQKVRSCIQNLNDKFRKRPDLQAIFSSLQAQVDDVSAGKFNAIFRHIKGKADSPDYRTALQDVDFLGALFEKTISKAFTGSNGQFFTPRNVIMLVVEMMSILEKTTLKNDMSAYTVCDPCCGSARFLIFWADKMMNDYRKRKGFGEKSSRAIHQDLQERLSKIAQTQLFGVDVEPQISRYAQLNMMMNGDGSTNIQNADSLDHFGFFAQWPRMQRLIRRFLEKLPDLSKRFSSTHTETMKEIRKLKPSLESFAAADEGCTIVDLNSTACRDLYRFVRLLTDNEHLGDAASKFKEWDDLYKNLRSPSVVELMKTVWAQSNPDISNGFDVIISNPPFGRSKGLKISDPYTLSQYALATQLWIGHASKAHLLRIIAKRELTVTAAGRSIEELRADVKSAVGGQQWFSVEEVENYARKVMLCNGDWEHTIHFDDQDVPIVFRRNVPKQILFIEQFLRMAKPGGKVFTVLDTGVLSNLEDEYVRRFLFEHSKVHAAVEFPHGAFKAANANVKTAVVMYERDSATKNSKYDIFGAVAQRMGYLVNTQATPITKQNDLGIILCDYHAHLGQRRLCAGKRKFGEPAGWKDFTKSHGDACKGLLSGSCPCWQDVIAADDLSEAIDLDASAEEDVKNV